MRISFQSIKAVICCLTLTYFMSVPITHASGWSSRFEKNKPDSACIVELAMTDTRSVVLGDIDEYVSNLNSMAIPISFDILLRHCPKVAAKAQVKFDGRLDRKNTDAFALNLNATASNIAIAVFKPGDCVRIPITPSLINTELNSPIEFSSILTYQTKYIATDNHVKPGTADAAIDFTVIYH